MTLDTSVGFLASGLVLAAFAMKDMVQLRMVSICSNVAFIAYGLSLHLTPVWVLHVVLLPMNGFRLMQVLQSIHQADCPCPAMLRYIAKTARQFSTQAKSRGHAL